MISFRFAALWMFATACTAVLGQFDTAAAALTVDRQAFDFGSVPVGSVSAAGEVQVANTGLVAAKLIVSVEGDAFALSEDRCGNAPLERETRCAIRVSFRPSAPGDATGMLRVDSDGKRYLVPLAGAGAQAGGIALSPLERDYGSVPVEATSSEFRFVATNTLATETGALAVQLTGSDAADFRIAPNGDDCSGLTLSPGTTCVVRVVFSPRSQGTKTASLIVAGAPGGTAAARLLGAGTPGAALVMSPVAFDFGVVDADGRSAGETTFTVTNRGNEPSGAIGTTLEGASLAFGITKDDCAGRGLEAGASCDVAVRFLPTTRGQKVGALFASAMPGGRPGAAFRGAGRDYVLLSVRKIGTGGGAIAGPGINCGTDCDEAIARVSEADPIVTLTAAPTDNDFVASWSIPACGTNLTCDVAMSDAKTVTVDFGVRPTTTILNAPPIVTNRSVAYVNVTSTPGSTGAASLECTFNRGVPYACTSPVVLTSLVPDVINTLQVAAVSTGGVRDLSPAAATFSYAPSTAALPRPLVAVSFDGNATNSGEVAAVKPFASNVVYRLGRFGQAVLFGGASTSFARLDGAAANLWSKSSFKWTIAFWFREDVASTNAELFDFRSASRGWQTYHGVNAALITTCGASCASFATPTAGEWHHILYRYDAASSTAATPVEIYLDGALVVTVGGGAAPSFPASVDGHLGLATTGGLPSRFYIDDFQVYDEVYSLQAQCEMILKASWVTTSPPFCKVQ